MSDSGRVPPITWTRPRSRVPPITFAVVGGLRFAMTGESLGYRLERHLSPLPPHQPPLEYRLERHLVVSVAGVAEPVVEETQTRAWWRGGGVEKEKERKRY